MHTLVIVGLICLVPMLTVGLVVAILGAFAGITLAVASAVDFIAGTKRRTGNRTFHRVTTGVETAPKGSTSKHMSDETSPAPGAVLPLL